MEEELKARIHNLEVLLFGYITITKDLLPPSFQEDVDHIFSCAYDASSTFPHFENSADFKVNESNNG